MEASEQLANEEDVVVAWLMSVICKGVDEVSMLHG
jgi:hypothetical protein